MIWIIIVLLFFLVFSVFTSVNFFRRSEYLEDKLKKQQKIFEEVIARIEFAERKMHEIDKSGHFEADDEVGIFFKNLKNIQGILHEFSIRFYENKAGEKIK